MMIQSILVGILILAAAAYLSFQLLQSEQKGCGSGCGSCSNSKTENQHEPKLIASEDLLSRLKPAGDRR